MTGRRVTAAVAPLLPATPRAAPVFGYLDCFSGVSGDKFLGALVDAGMSPDVLRERLAVLPLTGWDLAVEEARRAGLRATLVTVHARGAHPARSHADVASLIAGAALPPSAREGALRAFRLLAEAEGQVHGVPVADVHFHEVGAVDSIIDIVGAAIGISELGIEEVWSSPVCVGHGTVETAHGLLPVPAPATAQLLEGVPTYAGPIEGEMTTPTGAALLRAFVTRYAPAPPSETVALGYGAGQCDPSVPNVLRLSLCERGTWEGVDEQVTLIESVIDHLAPEHLAAALDLVRDTGALDVWQTPIVMKKGRLAAQVTVMCRPEDAARLSDELERQTGTLGVRRTDAWRSVAERRSASLSTQFGAVLVKVGGVAGVESARPEADEVARIARETGEGVAEVVRRLSGDLSGAGSQSTTE